MNGFRLWTNGGSGSSSILIPPIGVPELFCREVKVPHSWMIKGSPARLTAAAHENPNTTARARTIRHARDIQHLVCKRDGIDLRIRTMKDTRWRVIARVV